MAAVTESTGSQSVVTHAPRFTLAEAGAIARDCFGVTGTLTPLPSERDQNFHVVASDGRQFVLKIANALEELALLEAQNAAMRRVAEHGGAALWPMDAATGCGW
jgi:Ser/Thr protein kinase RdoA (MazF antagonist)